MTTINDLIHNERLQVLIFVGLSLVVAGFTVSLYFNDSRFFQRYFGSLNPLLALMLIVLLGLPFLSFLLSNGFSIYKRGNQAGLFIAAALAFLFGIVIILVDRKTPFPEGINIAFPQSLLFYPTMGYVVEVVFHIVLLSVLLLLLRPLITSIGNNKIIWVCIVIVSLIEPIYQTILGSERPYPLWPDLYVVLHIFLINLCQLAIFKRYDFISMYAFRLVYYLIWHIGWGHLRLELLF